MQPSPFVVNCSRQLKSASFVLKYMQDFSKHAKSAHCLARISGALTMVNLTSCLVARLREYISLLESVRLVGGTHYFGQEARGVDCDTQLRGCSNQIRLLSHCVVHKTYGISIVKVLLCCLSRCKHWSFGDSIEPAWPWALWTQDDRISNYPVITVTILIYSWISLRPSTLERIENETSMMIHHTSLILFQYENIWRRLFHISETIWISCCQLLFASIHILRLEFSPDLSIGKICNQTKVQK